MDTLRFIQTFLFCIYITLAANRYTSTKFNSLQSIQAFVFSRNREYMILSPYSYGSNNSSYPYGFNSNSYSYGYNSNRYSYGINNNSSSLLPLLLYKNNGTNYQKVSQIVCNCKLNTSIKGPVQMNSHGTRVIVSYNDSKVRIYQISEGDTPVLKQQILADVSYLGIILSGDGKYLLINQQQVTQIYQYNAANHLYEIFFKDNMLNQRVMSKDGQYIFTFTYRSYNYALYKNTGITYSKTQVPIPFDAKMEGFSIGYGMISELVKSQTYNMILLFYDSREGKCLVKFYQIVNSVVTEVQTIDIFQVSPITDMSSNARYLTFSFQSRKEIKLYQYNQGKNIYELKKQFWDLPAKTGQTLVSVNTDGSVASGVYYNDSLPQTERANIVFFDKCNIQLCDSCWIGKCVKCKQGHVLNKRNGQCGGGNLAIANNDYVKCQILYCNICYNDMCVQCEDNFDIIDGLCKCLNKKQISSMTGECVNDFIISDGLSIGGSKIASLYADDRDIFLILMALSTTIFILTIFYIYCRYTLHRVFRFFSKSKISKDNSSISQTKKYAQLEEEKENQTQINSESKITKDNSKKTTDIEKYARPFGQQSDQTKTQQLSN